FESLGHFAHGLAADDPSVSPEALVNSFIMSAQDVARDARCGRCEAARMQAAVDGGAHVADDVGFHEQILARSQLRTDAEFHYDLSPEHRRRPRPVRLFHADHYFNTDSALSVVRAAAGRSPVLVPLPGSVTLQSNYSSFFGSARAWRHLLFSPTPPTTVPS